MATDIGHSTTITFVTSGFSPELDSIEGWSGISRAVVETTHLSTTTAKTKIPGDLYDPGQLTIRVNFTANEYVGANTPIWSQAAEVVRITFPDSDTWEASGFVSDFSLDGVNSEGKMEATMTITFSGAITVTDN